MGLGYSFPDKALIFLIPL